MSARKIVAVLSMVVFSLVALPGAHAHLVWIEVEPSARPGKPQTVEVYFGEPQESLREEAGGRLDQHAGLRLTAADPQQQVVTLAAKKKQNCFAATFTPRAVGRHQHVVASLLHPVMDLTPYGGGPTKPMFYARAQSLVFEAGRVSEREPEVTELLPLDVVPVSRSLDLARGTIAPAPGGEFVVRAVLAGKPFVKKRLVASGPGGWMKELPVTDSLGITSFVPPAPGRYVLSVEHLETKAGEFLGQRYVAVSHRATFTFVVADAPAARHP